MHTILTHLSRCRKFFPFFRILYYWFKDQHLLFFNIFDNTFCRDFLLDKVVLPHLPRWFSTFLKGGKGFPPTFVKTGLKKEKCWLLKVHGSMEIVVLISTFFFCFIIWIIINIQCIGFEKIKSNQIKSKIFKDLIWIWKVF